MAAAERVMVEVEERRGEERDGLEGARGRGGSECCEGARRWWWREEEERERGRAARGEVES